MATSVFELNLQQNSLTGPLPSELGQMTSLTILKLYQNGLTGSIPSQFALMTHLEVLMLDDKTLAEWIGSIPEWIGSIPEWIGDLDSLAVNGSPEVLTAANNALTGTIPETLCSLGVYDPRLRMGLSLDCSDVLCGCCWCPCPCPASSYGNYCQTNPMYLNDEDWPGAFPTSINISNAITINICTDSHPEENSFEWSKLNETGQWEVLELGSLSDRRSVHSNNMDLKSKSIYRLQVFDSRGDGIREGWFTITNSTPSQSSVDGTVIWDGIGDALGYSLDVFIWVDSSGSSQLVEYIPGEGFALGGDQVIVSPDVG